MAVKILIQPNGNAIALGLEGSRQEIEETHTLFHNWGCHGELQGGGPRFDYFFTSPEQLERVSIAICLNRLINKGESDKYKGVKGGLWERAKQDAKEWVASFIPDVFIPRDEAAMIPYTYGIDDGLTAWQPSPARMAA